MKKNDVPGKKEIKVTVRGQTSTFDNMPEAREKVKKLIEAGVWYFNVE